MRAGILFNDFDIRVADAPDPQPGPGDVLIQSHFAGICGTDLHIYRGEFHSRVAFPAIQGHEFGGVVVDAGREVTRFKAGDRVVVDPIVSCHACPACLEGHVNACRTLKLYGVDLPGGFGQYIAVPAAHVLPLPEAVPMPFAPMVEMYALGHHILGRGRIQPGETVAILGAGKLGLSILDVLCHTASPSYAFVTDVQPYRLDVARRLGAGEAIDLRAQDPVQCVLEATGGVGVDCVIEAVGHYHLVDGQEAPLSQAVKMIRSGGRIVTAGLGEQLSAVHFKTLVLKEAQIIASRVTCGEFPRAIRMMEKGLLHPDLLVTGQAPMHQVAAAFQQVDREDPCTIKMVLDVQSI
ncbi:MAG: zinc-dependent alcohol dehydrogenase [Chloroflexota bacterium]